MTTHHLARAIGVNDTIAWLSTPDADLAALGRAVSVADSRMLRAALDHGRASQQFNDAAGAFAAAETALSDALALVDPTVDADLDVDNVLKAGDEYMVVRSVGRDTVEVGRGAFGSARAPHALAAVIYKADLRVEATFNIEVIVEGESGADVASGDKGDIVLPFAGRISGVKVVSDQGDLVLDVLRAAFPAAPVASIIGGGGVLPFLTAQTTYVDDVLTAWDAACAKDDVLRVLVVSSANVKRFTFSITYTTTTAQ